MTSGPPSQPYQSGVVSIDFSDATDLSFAATQPYPGEVADCASRTIRAITDGDGYAHFNIVGALIKHSGANVAPAPCLVHISCDGVLFGDAPAVAFDLDAVNGVNANDASLWDSDYYGGSPECTHKYVRQGL